jgi:hypothetical protein
MSNGNGGDSMLKVVELFIDNINESTKTSTQGMDRIETKVESIRNKVNTPPRNEELSKDIADIDKKLDTAILDMTELKTAIKLMINTVRVAVVVLGLSAIVSSAVVYFGNKSLVNQLSNQQNTELIGLKKSIEDSKGKGVIDEEVSRENG